MLSPARTLCVASFVICSAHAQQLKVVITPPSASSDSVIAVPPESSWGGSFNLTSEASKQKSTDFADWLRKETAINGLQSGNLQPWHIVITYDQFDEDGDNVHSGTIDELWTGPKKYKINYKSDNFNQTDYATDQGLFRLGDQRWANPAETQAREEVIDPFHYAATLQDVSTKDAERMFGKNSLDCVQMVNPPGKMTSPTQYCFDHNGAALRYSWGSGWDQTAYNDVVSFQERNLPRDVDVTHGGKPFLKLHVQTIELISQVNEKDFIPASDAVALSGQRLTGVSLKPLKTSLEWPDSMREEHFQVAVEIIVGKDGHVLSAHATSGPSNAYKAAESSAKKWIFQPYRVLGEPFEVETKILLNNN
jgi:hypothetical protein